MYAIKFYNVLAFEWYIEWGMNVPTQLNDGFPLYNFLFLGLYLGQLGSCHHI